MKQATALLFALLILLSAAACGQTAEPASETAVETLAADVPGAPEKPANSLDCRVLALRFYLPEGFQAAQSNVNSPDRRFFTEETADGRGAGTTVTVRIRTASEEFNLYQYANRESAAASAGVYLPMTQINGHDWCVGEWTRGEKPAGYFYAESGGTVYELIVEQQDSLYASAMELLRETLRFDEAA